ncbi:hypothetical protein QE399_001292 [Paracidovorax wautersii]|uniref:Uncharacterized protein n=2 Tax=Paracidovorax wautersii TaxID=1177982 RepID=A0ABU1I8P4_9BURK|nr:hypothetical protein [Paracidovorax wautersii]
MGHSYQDKAPTMTRPTPGAGKDPETQTPPDAPATSVQRSVDTQNPRVPPSGDLEGEDGSVPQLPHERDQSVGMTDGQPDENVEQAYRDVSRGLQDTDRGPPADRAYQKQKQQ